MGAMEVEQEVFLGETGVSRQGRMCGRSSNGFVNACEVRTWLVPAVVHRSRGRRDERDEMEVERIYDDSRLAGRGLQGCRWYSRVWLEMGGWQ